MSKTTENIISSVQRELAIRSESVQRIYNFYTKNLFYVNRRYQRKLVWNIEEKRAFIDSILKGFPVPIILLAQTKREDESVFEIIDGMQRLNAINSFIEGEFDLNGKYFNLETMVESKSELDKGKLQQKHPILERAYCEIIASYIVPLSIYSFENFENTEKIDEIFRRINSNGRHLSKQELRSAGATSKFADLVRLISSEIRTDVSASDILLLNDMKQISITNKQLEYGIKVDDIFWIKNKILTKEMLRSSKDEEILADIVAYILLPDTQTSNASILDDYYGFKNSDTQEEKLQQENDDLTEENNNLYEQINTALTLKDSTVVKKQFMIIYNNIRLILQESSTTFRDLICNNRGPKLQYVPRPFQIIFLSFYDLIFMDKMEITDVDKLIQSLNGINQDIDTRSGPTWNHQHKKRNINKIKGVIRDSFKLRENDDPALDSWLTEFETLLTQSKTEQSLYDFKQGFTELNQQGCFDQGNFDKIIKTLTAMVNHSPNVTGYVCVGVADNDRTAQRVRDLYGIDPIEYKNFKITGIDHEANKLCGNLDNFFKLIIQKIKTQPIDNTTKDAIGRSIKVINYFDRSVVIFRLKATDRPLSYENKFYQRLGANIDEIPVSEYPELFKRFP